jgi:predicted oxidoreductase
VVYDFSYEHILGSVENSLRRLGVDYLDILLLHRPDPLMEPEEVARAFDDLHRLGKVRTFGVSNHTAGQIELLNAVLDHSLLVNQVEISLGHPDLLVAGTAGNQRQPEGPLRHNDVVELAMRDGMTIQAWSPLARGVYSGAGTASDPAVVKTTELVAQLAAEYGTSSEAIVLGWIMRHPAGIVPIVGSTNPERIARSAEASELQISREHWYLLAAAARGMDMP